MEKPGTYLHPMSGKQVYGIRLRDGDSIKEGDVFNSTETKDWHPAPFAGIRVHNAGIIWVRPVPRTPAGAD